MTIALRAIGYYVTSNGAVLNQALHWNGTTWSVRLPPTV
jgi:hypothetical protein